MHATSLKFSRFALFLVFFWFGVLKVFDASPAGPMVLSLLDRTLPFIEPALFMVLFGIFEALIGILFLFKKTTIPALILLALHLITTTLPLILLPSLTWDGVFIPSMEGQYIIKNILIIAIGYSILASLAKHERTI